MGQAGPTASGGAPGLAEQEGERGQPEPGGGHGHGHTYVQAVGVADPEPVALLNDPVVEEEHEDDPAQVAHAPAQPGDRADAVLGGQIKICLNE